MGSRLSYNVSDLLGVLVRTTVDSADLSGTLKHIARTAQTFFSADICVIFAINPFTSQFIPSPTIADKSLEWETFHEQTRPEELLQQVLKRGILLVEDVEVLPKVQSIFTNSNDIRSFIALCVRMRYSQKPLGVIYLGFRQLRHFDSNDRELFHVLIEQTSFILEETWLLQRYQATVLQQRYQDVARIGQELNQERGTVDILFQKLKKQIAGIFDTSHTLLLAVYQAQTNTLDLYLEEEGHSSIKRNAHLEDAYQYIIETQQSLFIEHLSAEMDNLPFQSIKLVSAGSQESFIFVPLVLHDASLGIVSIQHPRPNAYTQEDQIILQSLANYIALALHNMQSYNSLSQLNETGQLLMQQLESKQVLQMTVDKIRDATQADIVILYPYESTHQHFIFPPRICGTLQASTLQSMYPNHSDHLATLLMNRREPIFAKKSTTLYNELRGDVYNRQGSFEQREQIRSTAAVPLWVGDESVGDLFVNFRQPQRFDATQKLLIEGLAHYAAIAIKNAQTFGTLSQRRVRELEILQHIERELSRTLDLESVLSTLLRVAHEQVPADEASILLYDPRMQALVIPAAIGPHAEARQKQIISLQESRGIERWVLENKRPARVDNVHEFPWRDLYIPVTADIVSELDVPLLEGEEAIGVLNFESTRERAFNQEDEDFLITLAGQAVLAIKNAQAYEREKRLAEEGQVLNAISKEITSQLDFVHVFDLILEKALALSHSTLGSLHLYDPDRNDLWMAAERGVAEDKKGQRLGLDHGVIGYSARNKQLLNVDVSLPPWNEIHVELIPDTRSELVAPMLAGNELRGVLNVESPIPNNFGESDERLLQGLADLAVVALQNAQAYAREKRIVAEAQVLNQISKEITSQLDSVHVFDLILEKALELTRSNLGNLMLYDPDRNDLWMAAERGVAEDKKGIRQKLGQGIEGYAAENKELLNVDVSEPPWNEIYLEFFPEARSEMAVPMLAGDELRGVLNVESPNTNNFTESDERLLQGLADLAVVALQNAERYKQAEREAQRFTLLYKAGQELGKITDLSQLEQAYDVILRIAEEYSQSRVMIHRYDEDARELVVIRSSEFQYPPISRTYLDIGINERVARERRTIVIHDTNNPPSEVIPSEPSDSTTRSLFITPITFKDRYYGNLGLSHNDISYFRGTDVIFFEGLAQQLATTIYRLETAQERQEFKQRALSAELMSTIGYIAFELTHRWDNELGLIRFYVNDIRSELKKLNVTNTYISKKLENISQAAGAILDLSKRLKQALVRSGEATAGEPFDIQSREIAGEPSIIHPRILLEEAMDVPLLPSSIQICQEVDNDVAVVRVIHSSVVDILRNLVANAIEAMPEGGKITLKACNAGRSVALEVTDTGIGIPQQSISKIFDLFYSTKGSSGFGLWSARHNALRNHGDLTVESQAGHGTTFTLLLPRLEGDAS